MRPGTIVFGLIGVVMIIAVALWIGVAPTGPASSVSTQTLTRTGDGLPAPPVLEEAEARPLVPHGADPGEPTIDLAAANLAEDDEPGHPVVFIGRVVDEDGAPLPGTQVLHLPSSPLAKLRGLRTPLMGMRVFMTPWEEFARTDTDTEGRFRLTTRELPPESTEQLRRDGPEEVGLVLQHPAAIARIERSPAGRAPDDGIVDLGDLLLAPAARLVGRLVDETGLPAPGVTARAAMESFMDSVQHGNFRGLLDGISDADGHFTVGSVPAGDGNVSFSGGPFVSASRPFQSPGSGILDLGEISLTPGQSIEGLVTDTEGRLLPGAEVLLRHGTMRYGDGSDPLIEILVFMSSGSRRTELRLTTDEDGRYRASGLSFEDTYDVIATADGHDAAVLRACSPGAHSHDLALVPEALLVLQVVDAASGLAVPCETVWGGRPAKAGSNTFRANLPVLSGAEAAAFLGRDGDPTGLAVVRKAGAHSHQVTITASGYPTTEVDLPGVPSELFKEHRVELTPGATLTGRVLDDEGTGLPALLTLRADTSNGRTVAGRSLRTNSTEDDGRFHLDLPEGAWSITAEAPGWRVSDPFELEASGTSTHEHTFVMDRGATLDLVVVDARGLPLPGVPLILRLGTLAKGSTIQGRVSRPHRATTDDQGRASFVAIPPGTYTTWLHVRLELDVPPGHTRQVLVRPDLPVLTGRVLRGGKPLPGARVQAGDFMFGGDDPELVTTTAADGSFRLSDALLSSGTDDDPLRWLVTAFFEDTPGESQVITMQPAEELDIDLLIGTATLSGVVLDDGGPLQGARVRAVNLDHLEDMGSDAIRAEVRGEAPPATEVRWNRAPTSTLTHDTTTDGEGAFVLPHLLPGRHVLLVEAEDHISRDGVEVLVVPGADPEPLSLQLERGRIVAGHLTRVDGTPGAALRVSLKAGSQSLRATTDEDGGFFISGVPEGSWPLVVRDPVTVIGVDNHSSELLRTQVTVPPEGLADLSLFLAPDGG